jgi:proton-coupled amino acid transporter
MTINLIFLTLRQPMLHFRAVAKNRWYKFADIALMVFGLLVMIYTTSLTVSSWISGDSVKPLPAYCDE